MSYISVMQEFHSVGHGTFFTSTVEVSHGDFFTWVYDCGSKRSKQIERAVTNLSRSQSWPKGVTLDMVVVSHFDDDHINGLELLLQRHRVKWLVLPFMSLKSRLAHTSSLSLDEPSSISMAEFAMNPMRYLVDRGLSNRIDGILLIRGGPSDGAKDGGSELPDAHGAGGPENFRWEDLPEDTSEYPSEFFNIQPTGLPQVRVLSHRTPVKASRNLPFEFIFYNTALPSGIAKRSRQPLSEVHKDVDFIFRTYRLDDRMRKPRSGWRDALKACYTRHFGSTGPERNNISLCVLARPLLNAIQNPYCVNFLYCSDSRGPYAKHHYQFKYDSWHKFPSDRHAVLLNGDLALNDLEIDAMKTHFGIWRWEQIGVTQVPHHGSQHSWKKGNAAHFGSSAFVQCVPTVSKNHNHPHPIVVADLRKAYVLPANYENAVFHEFLFCV